MNKIKNPLTIIGLFASIAETAGTVVLPFVSEELQNIFIWYIMGFPVFIVILFFITLNKNHKVLYAPSDFKDEDNFMKLITDATAALDNMIEKNPEMEKDLKPVENLIEKIPVNKKSSPIMAQKIMSDSDENSYILYTLNYENKSIPLSKYRTIIGRGNKADIIVSSHKVSRYHCEILKENAVFYVRDLDSANGTYINNKKINKSEELKKNDILRIGDIEFVFTNIV